MGGAKERGTEVASTKGSEDTHMKFIWSSMIPSSLPLVLLLLVATAPFGPAFAKELIITVPAPLTEFLKSTNGKIDSEGSETSATSAGTESGETSIPAAIAGCVPNSNFLSEDIGDYKKRISNLKWNPKGNAQCDTRFLMSHIQGVVNQPLFHHMNYDAALDAIDLRQWAQIHESETSILVNFKATPFSFETMGDLQKLATLYSRRIWKLTRLFENQSIDKIVLQKTLDNGNLVEKILETYRNAASAKKSNSSEAPAVGQFPQAVSKQYQSLAGKIEIREASSQLSLRPVLSKYANAINHHKELVDKEIAQAETETQDGDGPSDGVMKDETAAQDPKSQINPNILVISALYKYFSGFQRIDFVKDEGLAKTLKSVNNGLLTVHLMKEVYRILKDNPDYLRSYSQGIFKALEKMFSPGPVVSTGNQDIGPLSGFMSNLPNIEMDEAQCRDFTALLINLVNGTQQEISSYTLDELIQKALITMTPVISEVAITSINNLFAAVGFLVNQQPTVLKDQLYSMSDLNQILFQGIQWKEKQDAESNLVQIYTLFARLKEFYLHAYDALLLYADPVNMNPNTKGNTNENGGASRTPASEGDPSPIEQVLSNGVCPRENYTAYTRFFDTTDFDIRFTKTAPLSQLAVPVPGEPVEAPLNIDRVKAEIEKQMVGAANALPDLLAREGYGQLQQLIAVISQQGLSVAEFLKTSAIKSRSSFYFQLILAPRKHFNAKEAMIGQKYSVPPSSFKAKDINPLCNVGSVLMVLDFLVAANGQINFKLQWGIHLPDQLKQPLAEYTHRSQGLVVENPPGIPDQIHILDFMLLQSHNKALSHFALVNLTASGHRSFDEFRANIQFGPQMELLLYPDFNQNRAFDFKHKQNIFIEKPSVLNVFDGPYKNSETPPKEIAWSIGKNQFGKFFRGNVCPENETFGPILNLSKTYLKPLQKMFNEVGLYNVLMHSGKARIDEIEMELKIDSTQMYSKTYTPKMNVTKLDLQVFPYNLEGQYFRDRDQHGLHRFLDLPAGVSGPPNVLLNLGRQFCFPLPHNKEVDVMKSISTALDVQMPDLWKKARFLINQVRNIKGEAGIPETEDVEPINTDSLPETTDGGTTGQEPS